MRNTDTEHFRTAMHNAGLQPPEVIEPDGKLHRFSTNGNARDTAGWYVFYGDGIPAGAFGDWRTGRSESWHAEIGRTLSGPEVAAHRTRMAAAQRLHDEERARQRADAATRARTLWNSAHDAPLDHPYLVRKQIQPHGAREHDGALVLPVIADGHICSLQFIDADGSKRFLIGGRVKGSYFGLGDFETPDAVIYVAEGFATGATVHEATAAPVEVAFTANNLGAVATSLRKAYPDIALVICADDDANTPGNPGVTHAQAAAEGAAAAVAVPRHCNGEQATSLDFNDMAAEMGIKAVAEVLDAAASEARARHPVAANRPEGGDDWNPPLPLGVHVASEPYPSDALPDVVRGAVKEVQAFTQAPLALVACSALGALSLTGQAYVDVKRAERLIGPTSLFLLTIADSGERKSTCDQFFTEPIRDYDRQQREAMQPVLSDYRAAQTSWESNIAGIKDGIRLQAKKGQIVDSQRDALRRLEDNKPVPPRVPRLLRLDETPESLAWVLAREWPAAGVVSAEAGLVFGAHAMGKDSIMRNLALLNVLWDGGTLPIGRRTTESFTVQGARLTVALQVQDATLRNFVERSGGLARGTGFLARFLLAWPESTQGQRLFVEAPTDWPQLSAFHQRVAELLEQAAPIDEHGALSPVVLSLDLEAKRVWVRFHDDIERQLCTGGELAEVRDVASKAADNAARLAALFHAVELAPGGAVGPKTLENAARIVAWHVNEARRVLGDLVLSPDLTDAERLDRWLVHYCRDKGVQVVSRRELQRNVTPVHLRKGTSLDEALKALEEVHRVRQRTTDRRKDIQINPALLREVQK